MQPAKGGPTEMKHIKHFKYVLPTDRYINQLPSYSKFGRKATLRINPDQIPDLRWKLVNTYHTMNIRQITIKDHIVHEVTLHTSVDTDCTILDTETHTTQSKCETLVCSVLPIT